MKHWHDIQAEDWPWPNFMPAELACRGDGSLWWDEDFMGELQELRDKFGAPMHITSGFRSREHNRRIGGAPHSFHMGKDDRGLLAVDVAAVQGDYRGKLFAVAWNNDWSIGWNAERGFLHLDRRIEIGWRQTTFDY